MLKAHLVSSNDPLVEYRTYHAVCGAVVPDAIFPFFFIGEMQSFRRALEEMENSASSLQTCRKCIEAQVFLDQRYVYAVVQAKRTPESDRVAELAVA